MLNGKDRSVYEFFSDYVLDYLAEEQVPIEVVADRMKQSIANSIEDNYQYFKTQYERISYLRNAFTDKSVDWSGTLEVEEDSVSGDFYVTLPEDVLEKTGWQHKDLLEWAPQEDGSYVLRKYVSVATDE